MSSKSKSLASTNNLSGKQKWNEQRRLWTSNKSNTKSNTKCNTRTTVVASNNTTTTTTKRVPTNKPFNYDQTIDDIINQEPFAIALPLPLLIDTLVDLWEADGLFD